VDQRQDFLEAAAQLGVPAHAVVLQLPKGLCTQRAAARQQHEGNVSPAEAPRVVASMAAKLEKAGPPAAAEGLRSIMVCRSDADMARALGAWCSFGAPAAGAGGQQRAPASGGGGGGEEGGGAGQAGAGRAGEQQAQEQAQQQQQPAAGAGGGPDDMAPWQQFSRRHMAPAAGREAQGGGQAAAQGSAAAGWAAGGSGSAVVVQAEHPAKRRAVGTEGVGSQKTGSPDRSHPGSATQPGQQRSSPAPPAPRQPRDAFALMAAAAKGAALAPPQATRPAPPPAPGPSTPLDRAAEAMRARLRPAWARKLLDAVELPGPQLACRPGCVVDERCVLMPDLYPKARHHALVVARDAALWSVYDVRAQHAPLLRHMLGVARAWVAALVLEQQGRLCPGDFSMGFHAVPSMRQLHMHVLSRDLDSPHLKNKKHWNSFTTAFFRDAGVVLEQVERTGELAEVDLEAAEALLQGVMRCNRCGAAMKGMPQLKQHIAGCRAGGGGGGWGG
jgi:aprataxin